MSANTNAVQRLYVAYFSRPSDPLGQQHWETQLDNLTKGAAATQAQLETVAASFSGSAEYANLYAGLNSTGVVNQLYLNLFGRNAESAGLLYWAGELEAGRITFARLALQLTYSAQGSDASAVANKLAAATAFTQALNTADEIVGYTGNVAAASARSWLGQVSGSAASLSNALATVDTAVADATSAGGPGQTFALTAGTDTVPGLVGSSKTTSNAGNDTFDASTVVNSWTIFDKIDGGSGVDTMNVVTSGSTVPDGATLSSVENLSISTTGAGYTINATSFQGLRNLSLTAVNPGPVNVTASSTTTVNVATVGTSDVDIVGSGGAMAVTAGSGRVYVGQTAVANRLTSVTVNGGGDGAGTDTIAITDRSGDAAAVGSSLTTVTLNGAADDTTITANGLTTLDMRNLRGASTVGDVTVNAAAGARELTMRFSGVDAGAAGATAATTLNFTDATATGLILSASTAASSDLTISAASAATIAITASESIQFDAINAAAAKTASIAGSSSITISSHTLNAAAVITSTASGGVTLSQELLANQQFTGTSSSGNDVLSVASGGTKAMSTGAGRDTVFYGGPLGAGGSVDAGADEDTIVMSGAEADAADANGVFNNTWKNFEVLQLEAGANVALDMLGLASISKISTQGSSLTLSNIASGATLTLTGSNTSATANVTAATFNDNDSFNLVLSNASATSYGNVILPNIETITIVSTDATPAGGAAVINSLTLQATSAKTVTVTGNNGLTLTNTGNTAITTFNASGVVANNGSDTAANLGVTFYSANATAGALVAITGGDGSDVLGGSALTIDTISGRAGDDRIIGDVNAEVQNFTITTAANATGSMVVLVLGTAVTVAGAADVTTTDTASRIVTAINGEPGLAGRVTASNEGGTSPTVTLTYAQSSGNVITAGGVAALGGNAVVASPVAVVTDGSVNTRPDILSGGAGNDIFYFGAGSQNTIANADTILDLDLGLSTTVVDTLVFGNSGASRSVVVLTDSQQAAVSAAATLAAAVEAALQAIAADGATGIFTHQGNSYLLHNGDGNSTYNPTADYLIRVTGVTGTLDIGDISLV